MRTDYKQMDDKALVERLLRNDQEAWEYVLMDVALRIARQQKFSEMLHRTSHEPMEAVTELCQRLYKDDFALLRTFAFKGSFEGWLRMVVWSVVQKVTGLTGKDNQGREIPGDPQDPTSAFNDPKLSTFPMNLHMTIMDKRAAFSRFWHEKPEGAFILLLKNELELPLDIIGVLLDRPANTISQMARRAEARMSQLEQE